MEQQDKESYSEALIEVEELDSDDLNEESRGEIFDEIVLLCNQRDEVNSRIRVLRESIKRLDKVQKEELRKTVGWLAVGKVKKSYPQWLSVINGKTLAEVAKNNNRSTSTILRDIRRFQTMLRCQMAYSGDFTEPYEDHNYLHSIGSNSIPKSRKNKEKWFALVDKYMGEYI